MTQVKKTSLLLATATVALIAAGHDASAQQCTTMRKINIGVSVAPPNVVHTSPYVAKELGYFAKRCIDATIVQFEGGQSATSAAAAVQGTAIVSVSDVAIGRGIKSPENIALAQRLADVLGADLAASRPICDSDWLPIDRQIGSSGQTVAPKLYIALGISGAIQHIVGMKNAGTIVADGASATATRHAPYAG